MIGLKNKNWTEWVRAIILICISFYYLLQWINLLLSNYGLVTKTVSFGFPFTLEWTLLNSAFWSSILIGSIFLIMSKRLGSLLINGALLCVLTYLGFKIVNTPNTLLMYLQAILIFTILFPSKLTNKVIWQSLAIYVFWGMLFLTINQRWNI